MLTHNFMQSEKANPQVNDKTSSMRQPGGRHQNKKRNSTDKASRQKAFIKTQFTRAKAITKGDLGQIEQIQDAIRGQAPKEEDKASAHFLNQHSIPYKDCSKY